MPERPGRSRASIAVACVVLAGTGVLLAPTAACTPHNCDGSSATFVGTDDMVTPLGNGGLLFQSSPVGGEWLDYPGNRTITVKYPPSFTHATQWYVMVSTGPDQQEAGATATTASGQLDSLLNLEDRSFQLQNASCADYFVYFAVTGSPLPVLDAGAATDAPHD